MTMHAANIEKSKRLQGVVALLSDGQWHSSFEIQIKAQVCSGSTTISELLKNGLKIEGRAVEGHRYKEYRLLKVAETKPATQAATPLTQMDFFKNGFGGRATIK